jgi:cysteinyl-tRNA synthetase
MSLVVYNTLTRKKEPFEPVTPGKVGIYLCGPTVYKPSHVGHAVGPIIFDAIKRYLVFRGYKVTWVVNITDVDDKLIVEAAKQGTTTLALAERITKDYLAAMKLLHVDGIDIMPKASESMGDIVAIIQRLMDNGCAYVSGGDVYFDVSRDADYGKLSNRRFDDQEGQRDLQSGEKRNAGDFALWKGAKPEEPDDVKFDSPWGKGRPGWHIECSAMASRYLGETFDIHGGGLDLIFPHHENEIAQSESANDKPFAKYWLHNGLTRVNTKKISKSDASPEMVAALAKMTLHNLLATYPPELIRFFVLSTHYRRPIEYSEEEIESKRKGLDTFYRLFERVERLCGQSPYAATSNRPPLQGGPQGGGVLAAACERYTTAFTDAMDDDFNTASAIAAMFDCAGDINRYVEAERLETVSPGNPEPRAEAGKQNVLTATACLIELGRLIGVFIDPPLKKSADDGTADKAMKVLIQIRQYLRKKKDFESADLIRNLLAEQKITLEDRPDGTVWRAE